MANIKLTAMTEGLDNLNDENLGNAALRKANNIEIEANGRITSAPTAKLVRAGSYKYLYADDSIMLGASDAALDLVDKTSGIAKTIKTMTGRPVCFCKLLDGIAFTDGTSIGIVRNGEAEDVGIDTPTIVNCTASAGGGLFEGRYAVAITAISTTGEESGLSAGRFVDVGADGGIVVKLPAAPANVEYYDIYRTGHNGDIYYKSVRHPAAITQVTIGMSAHIGAAATTQNLDRMPAGTIIRYWKGRLLASAGNTIWFSEPMRYGLTSLRHNFFQFSHEVTMLQETDGGIFCGTSKGEVYFLAGNDPATMEVRLTGGKNPIPFCSTSIDMSELDPSLKNIGSGRGAIWLAENGFVVGLPDGTLLEAQRNRIHRLQGEAGEIAVLDKRVRATTRLSSWENLPLH